MRAHNDQVYLFLFRDPANVTEMKPWRSCVHVMAVQLNMRHESSRNDHLLHCPFFLYGSRRVKRCLFKP
jgi:hypothetical protein